MQLQDRALLIKLRIESWGTTKKDRRANRVVSEAMKSADSATQVSKRLCPEGALKAVKAKADEAREYVRTVTSPWTDDGARLIQAEDLLTLQAELRRKYRPAWEQEVAAVVQRLAEFRDQWGPANLGDMYDKSLYPDAAGMYAEFAWNVDILPLNPNSRELRVVLGNEYVDQIQKEAEARILQTLYSRIAAPIENMVARLQPTGGSFKDTLVSNVKDIAALIPALNVTGDPNLDALRQRIENELTHFGPETLRHSHRARRETAAKAKAILDNLSAFMPPEPPAEGGPTLDMLTHSPEPEAHLTLL